MEAGAWARGADRGRWDRAVRAGHHAVGWLGRQRRGGGRRGPARSPLGLLGSARTSSGLVDHVHDVAQQPLRLRGGSRCLDRLRSGRHSEPSTSAGERPWPRE
jgi:hypothetical protein